MKRQKAIFLTDYKRLAPFGADIKKEPTMKKHMRNMNKYIKQAFCDIAFITFFILPFTTEYHRIYSFIF
ncbi:hypothetical protein NUKP18_54250 [Klebsiella variicola]|nr:hypothetical protein NUKP18_54250 [Klebsiella variicola]